MEQNEWLTQPIKTINETDLHNAQLRQNNLTKPPGSLGVLETVAVRLSAMQGKSAPQIKQIHITVFAADHGIAAENVSAFPQAVTAEMVKNFSAGGAAISVLSKQLGARLEVVNLGTVATVGDLPGVVDQVIAESTASFLQQPAMTEVQLTQALEAGRQAVQRAQQQQCDLFIAGDMGIANTSAATAMACALLNCPASELAGRGTGLDDNGLNHKIQIIQQSLDKHQLKSTQLIKILQTFGGFEIAAMTAAYIACGQKGITALVDGFIATSAALLAIQINPQVKNWLMFSHASAEPGHQKMMQAIDEQPLLDLNLRLGEASGAAVAVPLLHMACALHNEMATFEQAGVSEGL